MITVAETGEFQRKARRLLKEVERDSLIWYLSEHPESGDLMEEAGGIRKFRWGMEGRGKRGGARVIYYYHSDRMPLYLLSIYGKNEKDNLTASEKRDLRALTYLLKKANRL